MQELSYHFTLIIIIQRGYTVPYIILHRKIMLWEELILDWRKEKKNF